MNTIKLLLFTLSLGFFEVNAASPIGKREQMRMNFGAGYPVFRVNVSHYGEMYPGGPNSAYGHGGNSEEGMKTRLLINAEAMVMLNNFEKVKTDGFSDKDGHFEKRPRFLNLQASYDYFNMSNTISASLAQSVTCNMGLGFLGYMRGYWSAGIASRSNRSAIECVDNLGAQLAFNLYSARHALVMKCNYYPTAHKVYSEKLANDFNTNTKILLNLNAYKRLSDRVLYELGIENNCPKTGFSYLGGNWRVSANLRILQKQTQYGFTLNHSF